MKNPVYDTVTFNRLHYLFIFFLNGRPNRTFCVISSGIFFFFNNSTNYISSWWSPEVLVNLSGTHRKEYTLFILTWWDYRVPLFWQAKQRLIYLIMSFVSSKTKIRNYFKALSQTVLKIFVSDPSIHIYTTTHKYFQSAYLGLFKKKLQITNYSK